MISDIERFNELVLKGVIKESDLVMVGGDVVSLFPSLDPEVTAQEVRKEFEQSELEVEVNWKEVSKYVAMNSSETQIKESGLERVIATRKYSRGRRPGITSKESLAP